MKKWIALIVLSLVCFSLFAQKPSITWGEEFKMRKGSTSLEVVHADNSGVYLQEGHLAIKSYFVIGATARVSARLVKLDKRLGEVFNTDFNKELKGKEFMQFFVLRNKMFIVASEYDKRDAAFIIHAAEINKGTGEIAGTWKQLASISKNEKKDDVDFKIAYNTDSSRMVIVSSLEGKARNSYRVMEFNEALRATGKEVQISNEFDPKTYQLEDLIYTNSKRIVLVGRVYEYREGKKKKEKFLDFANYNIRIYDEAGKQLKELNTSVNGKWLTSTKIVQENNKDLVLAGFYSNDRKDKTIDGMLLQRIDPVSGNVVFSTEKNIDHSMLNALVEESAGDKEDEKETKEERKERERLEKIKDEGEAFSTLMKFRNIYYTADGGLVILAEKFRHYVYTTQTYTPGTNGMPGQWRTVTYSVYESGDLLMCRVNAARDIDWIRIIPKSQREVLSGGSTSSSGISFSSFFESGSRPYYSGFSSMQAGNTIFIFFNDNPKNAAVLQPGQKIKTMQRFSTSDCFTVALDEATGKYERKFFFSNTGIPTSMTRHGSIFGKEMYVVGKEDRIIGKSKIAVGKISLGR